MSYLSSHIRYIGLAALLAALSLAQETPGVPAKQPLEHVLGTISALDPAAHTVTVKEDKTNAERVIQVANTRTLIKVEPGAKDLKSAVRITAADLQVGDRVDVRGTKLDETSGSLDARSVVLMSARDLQQVHQQQAAAWQHSTAGTVTSVEPSGKINITVKGADGVKAVVIETTKATEFTRYSPANSKTPATSQLSEIQPGDQVRVVGDKSADGASITAQKVYSGAFRTLSATVTAIAADGKSVTVKDLATKKEVSIALNDDTTMRKLPTMMAYMLARRFNPNFKMPAAADGAAPPAGGAPGGGAGNWHRPDGASPDASSRPAGGPPSGGMRGGGDVSQALEHAPKITLADLKAGDALVISGVALGADNSHLVASNIIAGVEPILQSAPAQSGGRSVGGDWGLGEMSAPQ
jgi:hypothetical protein